MKIRWVYNFEIPSSKRYDTVDALAELLIEKGLPSDADFMEKLSAGTTGYQAMLEKGNISGGHLSKNSMAL